MDLEETASLRNDGFEHVKECPATGKPCPCLPGSISHAHCLAQAESMMAEDFNA